MGDAVGHSSLKLLLSFLRDNTGKKELDRRPGCAERWNGGVEFQAAWNSTCRSRRLRSTRSRASGCRALIDAAQW
jgi:hypothetical protein